MKIIKTICVLVLAKPPIQQSVMHCRNQPIKLGVTCERIDRQYRQHLKAPHIEPNMWIGIGGWGGRIRSEGFHLQLGNQNTFHKIRFCQMKSLQCVM